MGMVKVLVELDHDTEETAYWLRSPYGPGRPVREHYITSPAFVTLSVARCGYAGLLRYVRYRMEFSISDKDRTTFMESRYCRASQYGHRICSSHTLRARRLSYPQKQVAETMESSENTKRSFHLVWSKDASNRSADKEQFCEPRSVSGFAIEGNPTCLCAWLCILLLPYIYFHWGHNWTSQSAVKCIHHGRLVDVFAASQLMLWRLESCI